MSTTRRDLLKGLGLGALAAATGGCKPRFTEPPTRTPDPTTDWPGDGAAEGTAFPYAVMSGDPASESLVLWTKYTGEGALSVRVARWEPGEDEATPGRWVEHATIAVTPGDAGFCKVVTDGLASDQPVAYQFSDDAGNRSDVGYGRTSWGAERVGPLRIVAVSCSAQNHDEFPSMTHALNRGPCDLMIWAGDTIYTEGEDLNQIRATWRENYTSDTFRAVFPMAAHTFTWDDHEVSNNWDPETIDPERMAAATDAFFEHTPTRRDAAHPARLWRSFLYGQTAEIFFLDGRAERRPSTGEYLSRDQLDWVKAGVSASSATWKIIVNSVPITRLPGPFQVEVAIADRWEGFPATRDELLGHLSGIPGVLFLSGDHHMPTLARVEPEGPLFNVFEILTGPAGSFRNPLGPVINQQYPEQIPWSDAQWNSTILEAREDGSLYVAFVDEADAILYEAELTDLGEIRWQVFGDAPA